MPQPDAYDGEEAGRGIGLGEPPKIASSVLMGKGSCIQSHLLEGLHVLQEGAFTH
jgi:hypothetical protein